MTTATTTATATINIISALPKWVQSSLEINGTPDGWVPCHCLGLTIDDLTVAYEANIIDICPTYFKDIANRLIDSNIRFVEENVITIYNWLQ